MVFIGDSKYPASQQIHCAVDKQLGYAQRPLESAGHLMA